MSYRWKPSKAQRKEFAQNMQNTEYAQAYYSRKEEKAKSRRADSQFDYSSAGGNYIPTKAQSEFCFNNAEVFITEEEKTAMNMVISGWSCNERIHHDYIHVVNDKIRATV